MSHRLQLRRGTTAKNDRLTGLAGEVTFDTDKKTLRIHDGETLGGIELARHDSLPPEPFDINSVLPEFWRGIIDRIMKKPIEIETLTSNGTIDKYHDWDAMGILGNSPLIKYVMYELKCVAGDAGYQPGDDVAAFGLGEYNNPRPFVEHDGMDRTGTIHYGNDLLTFHQKFWVSHRETGVKTEINPESWVLQVRFFWG